MLLPNYKKILVSLHVTDNGEAVETHSALPRVISYIPYGEIFVEQQSGGWQSPYLFNAKELDSETGLYYYGARYLDPTSAAWLSVDPLWEKNIAASPYNYCHGNPITVVDPNGMDDYSVDPNGYVKHIKNSNVNSSKNTLYAVNKDGKTINSITIENGNMLKELSGSHSRKISYDGDYTITKSKEVGKLFTFLASNTDVEWNLGKFKGGTYGLGTKHKSDGVLPFYRINLGVFNVDNLIYNVHSHPSADGTKGASNVGVIINGRKPDFYQIKEHAIEFSKKQSTLKCENKFNEIEFPKFFVFHKYSSHLYQYTPFTSSIDMGSVNKENSLFKRIDGSKSSVFKPKP